MITKKKCPEKYLNYFLGRNVSTDRDETLQNGCNGHNDTTDANQNNETNDTFNNSGPPQSNHAAWPASTTIKAKARKAPARAVPVDTTKRKRFSNRASLNSTCYQMVFSIGEICNEIPVNIDKLFEALCSELTSNDLANADKDFDRIWSQQF